MRIDAEWINLNAGVDEEASGKSLDAFFRCNNNRLFNCIVMKLDVQEGRKGMLMMCKWRNEEEEETGGWGMKLKEFL